MQSSPSSVNSNKTNRCALQTCNIVHILCGAVALALTGMQFTQWYLENYQTIDFRLVNGVHLLTGCVGMYVVIARRGSVAAKTMYCISITVALITTGFYADAAFVVAYCYLSAFARQLLNWRQMYDEYRGLRADNLDKQVVEDALGRFIICLITVGVGIVAIINSATSLAVLDSLASNYPVAVRHCYAP